MNRETTTAEYTWSIRERPNGSRATVSNPIGSVSESVLFEHIYETIPTFSPDQPGEYLLIISATGEFTDGTSVAFADVQHEVRISVSGMASQYPESGCNVSPSSRGISSIFALMFALIVGLGMRLRSVHSS